MDQDSRIKVMKAGFSIIRADDYPSPRIKVLVNSCGDYKTLEAGFKSKAARNRRFEELMSRDNILTD